MTGQTALRLYCEDAFRVFRLPVRPAGGGWDAAKPCARASVNPLVGGVYATALGSEVTDDSAEAVVEFDRRLDGLALAIRVAVAAVWMRPTGQPLLGLGHRVSVLAGSNAQLKISSLFREQRRLCSSSVRASARSAVVLMWRCSACAHAGGEP